MPSSTDRPTRPVYWPDRIEWPEWATQANAYMDALEADIERKDDVIRECLESLKECRELMTKDHDRITELEGALRETVAIVENVEWEDDRDAPTNDDMNRWHTLAVHDIGEATHE